MHRISRIASFRLLSLVLLAGALAACGVKGELEPPPRAASAAPVAPVESGAGSTIRTERSEVRRVPREDMTPQMPPREWEKAGAEKSGRTSSEPRAKSVPSDRPFILDGLL